MPYFLRAIYSNTKWEKVKFPSWLKEGELPSRIIRDLRADDDALSLWEIHDDKSNLLQVIAALASENRLVKNDFDYALINKNHLDELSFTPSKKTIETAYLDGNIYHRDASNLSINNVVYFAYLLSKYGIFNRMGWKKIESRLKDAAKNKRLDLEKLKPELKKQLDLSE